MPGKVAQRRPTMTLEFLRPRPEYRMGIGLGGDSCGRPQLERLSETGCCGGSGFESRAVLGEGGLADWANVTRGRVVKLWEQGSP